MYATFDEPWSVWMISQKLVKQIKWYFDGYNANSVDLGRLSIRHKVYTNNDLYMCEIMQFKIHDNISALNNLK